MTKKLSRVVRYFALLLTASMLIGVALPQKNNVSATAEMVAIAEQELEAVGGYQQLMESDSLLFYIETDSGKFALVNKNTGAIWYSNPTDLRENTIDRGLTKTNVQSQLVLEYVNVLDINKDAYSSITNSFAMCNTNYGNTGSIKVSEREDGTVKVLYDFGTLGIVVPVIYSIESDYFEAKIDTVNIDEGDENRIVNLTFLPYFGAAGPKENGYLFVPDGCGAVAEFNSGIIPYTNYNKMIYGDDNANLAETSTTKEENILFPVFGTVVEGKGAMFGIVTKGDGSSKIIVNTGSSKTYYNSICTQLAYRICAEGKGLYASQANGQKRILTLTDAPYGVDGYTVRYYLLDGEKASYSGMAETYRNYLVKEKGLKKNASKPSLALEIYGALETKENILGVTYQKDQKLTSYSDVKSILSTLKKSGVGDIAVQYIGWTNNGVYNRKYPTSASALSALGGKSDFKDMKSYLDKQGIEYYMAADFVTFNKNSLGITANKNSAKTTNGDNAEIYEYSVVTGEQNLDIPSWYLMRPQDLIAKSQKFFKSFEKLGLDSIGLTNIGNTLYSDFSNDGGIFRSKSIEYFEEFVKSVDGKVKNISVNGGNSYVIPYVSRVYDAPMTSSQYDIFTYDVPFYQMVLHGYVNYTTCPVVQSIDKQTVLLKSIETGADLLYTCTGNNSYNLRETRLSSLYSSKFSVWKESAIEFYEKNNSVNSKIWNQEIVDHKYVAEDCFKTVYANGVTVYVNYSENNQTVDGVTVKAENYFVKEANA
ncbi:MAG: hypothetical protein J6J13_05235 [Clostridia bacterium]|nr:hypothetical protein [Clostridia bacterium]